MTKEINTHIPRCSICGQFITCDADYKFTPDSDYSTESIEYLCTDCWEEEYNEQ